MDEHEEGFARRWSRLKRAAAYEEEPAPAPVVVEAPPCGPVEDEPVEPPLLPSIASLGADSDYTAFLRAGVPAELRRLALRKAWSSDPKIRGFRGFAEYDWDCNAPGYGKLLPIDDIKRLCDAVLGEPPPEPEPAAAAPEAGEAEAPPPAEDPEALV